MAIIHQGVNAAEEELRQYSNDYVAQQRNAWKPIAKEQKKRQKRERRTYRKGIANSSVSLVIALLLLAALLLFPQIIRFLSTALQELSAWLLELAEKYIGGLLIDKTGDPLVYTNPLDVVRDVAVKLLLIIVTFVLEWLGKLSRPIVMIVLYGWSGMTIIKHVISLISNVNSKPVIPDPVFDDAQARYEARLNMSDKQRIKLAGLEGERDALLALKTLPDDCHIFTNLLIPYEGRTSETDLIIVSPHAITIAEVKNYKESIRGDWGDEHLFNDVQRGETVHTKQFYNPIRQVATHAYCLKGFLKENGVDVWVNTCVFFPNVEVNLRWVSDRKGVLEKCPVFDFIREDMDAYLLGKAGPRQDIPVRQVTSLLDELLKNPPARPEY